MPYSKKGGKIKPYPGPTSKSSLKKKSKKHNKRMGK